MTDRRRFFAQAAAMLAAALAALVAGRKAEAGVSCGAHELRAITCVDHAWRCTYCRRCVYNGQSIYWADCLSRVCGSC